MDHDPRWAAVEQSSLAGLYIYEVRWLLISCVDAAARLADLAPADLGDVMKVDGSIGVSAIEAISSAARLNALLFAAPRRKGESLKRFELRKRRASWLRDRVFDGVDVSVLNDRGVRNSIEHFDDRLDEVAEKATDGVHEFPLTIVSDVALGRPGLLEFLERGEAPPKTVQHVRTYVASTNEYRILRWSFDVGAVARCCRSMLDHLVDSGYFDARLPEERAGLMLSQRSRPQAKGILSENEDG